MSNQVSLVEEFEVEFLGTLNPGCRGRGPSMSHAGGSPAEPTEIEDLYVGVIILGVSVDITDLLSKKQRDLFEERLMTEAQEKAESDRMDAAEREYDLRNGR